MTIKRQIVTKFRIMNCPPTHRACRLQRRRFRRARPPPATGAGRDACRTRAQLPRGQEHDFEAYSVNKDAPVTDDLQPADTPAVPIRNLIRNLDLGKSVAEFDEALETYFIETTAFRELINDKIDIIAGDKGTGKTAIYRSFTKNIQLFLRSTPRK